MYVYRNIKIMLWKYYIVGCCLKKSFRTPRYLTKMFQLFFQVMWSQNVTFWFMSKYLGNYSTQLDVISTLFQKCDLH